MIPTTQAAYKLFHEGTLALTDVEENGIRIDMDHLDDAIERTKKRIKLLTRRAYADPYWKFWQKVYKAKTKIGSRAQLAHLLYHIEGHPVTSRTKTGAPQADEKALSKIDNPFLEIIIALDKQIKVGNTYLRNIKKETQDGFIHPSYQLHSVATFRSSCSNPNFQNMPIRDKKIGKVIRKCFIAREGHQIVEADLSGAEVCVSACYNKDPKLIEYIMDPSSDMHRDMAGEMFLLPVDQIIKPVRYMGKNCFVFPEFYGDYFVNCAQNSWDELIKGRFLTADGKPVLKHLKEQGIKRLGACDPDKKPVKGTFEYHMKEVEDHFWNDRFKVYSAWKDEFYQDYQRRGGYTTYTGFRSFGVYSKNEVTNAPIQGSAFHCLLWILTRVNKWLKRNKMRTKIIGQIHDSIIADVHKDELDDYVSMVRRTATIWLPATWKWIIVPITIDVEVAPLGGSWYDKKEI